MVVEWESCDLRQLEKRAAVWYREHLHGSWQQGRLKDVNGDSVQVTTLVQTTITLPLKDVKPANPEDLIAVRDITSLPHLNEPSLLHTLCIRYKADNIYSKAGPVLIVLNPCKSLPLYEPEMASIYTELQPDLEAQVKNRQPHIFLKAGEAFRDMVHNQQVRPCEPAHLTVIVCYLEHEMHFSDPTCLCLFCILRANYLPEP